MSAVGTWLDELVAALTTPSDDARIEELVIRGCALLSHPSNPVALDAERAAAIERVRALLTLAARRVSDELDAVRVERRQLAALGRGHAGYTASLNPVGRVPMSA